MRAVGKTCSAEGDQASQEAAGLLGHLLVYVLVNAFFVVIWERRMHMAFGGLPDRGLGHRGGLNTWTCTATMSSTKSRSVARSKRSKRTPASVSREHGTQTPGPEGGAWTLGGRSPSPVIDRPARKRSCWRKVRVVSMDGPRILVVGYAEPTTRAPRRSSCGHRGAPERSPSRPGAEPGNLSYTRRGRTSRSFRPVDLLRHYQQLVHEATWSSSWRAAPNMDMDLRAALCLWAAAREACLAYAVDAGGLSPWNRALVRRVASTTDLIVTRSRRQRTGCGHGASPRPSSPRRTTPCVRSETGGRRVVAREWPDAADGVGLAPVDFFRFPVVIRPWGRREDVYRWPYYFSSPGAAPRELDPREGYAGRRPHRGHPRSPWP